MAEKRKKKPSVAAAVVGKTKGAAGYDELVERKRKAEEAEARLMRGDPDAKRDDSDAWMLVGLELPPRLTRGRVKDEDRLGWLMVIETLMARGVDTPARIARLLHIQIHVVRKWMDDVGAVWKRKITADEIALRRAALWQEAAEVGRQAMRQAMATPNHQAKARYLKVVLEANARKAKLYGLDTERVDVEHTVKAVTGDLSPEEFTAKYGLNPELFVALGRQAAKGLSVAATRTIDAQLADDREEAEAAKVAKAGGNAPST